MLPPLRINQVHRRLFASFSHTPRTLLLVWRASPGSLVSLILLGCIAGLLPVSMAWVGKHIVDTVVSAYKAADGPVREQAQQLAKFWVCVEFGLAASVGLVERLITFIRETVSSRLAIDINVRIIEKALRLEQAQFENPVYYDKLTRARQEASSRPGSLMNSNLLILRNGIAMAGFVVVLAQFDWWAVVGLVAAATPAFFAEVLFTGKIFRLRTSKSEEARRLRYIETILSSAEYSKEVKLFSLGPFLLSRYRSLASRLYEEEHRVAIPRMFSTAVLTVVAAATFYACYFGVVLAALGGRISLGSMTLYAIAFRQTRTSLQSFLAAVGSTYEDNLYMSNLFEFLNEESESVAKGSGDGYKLETGIIRVESGIRFDRVSFRYREGEEWAVRDLSLFVASGDSLALVGANGAGKSTIIKLLTGLYHPTSGRVLIDGRDLRNWPSAELRKRMAVIYQDFNRYEFTVRENVGFGSLEALVDDQRISMALEHGGARKFVSALPKGIDNKLGRSFDGGTELSGGQWQKIALSRVFIRKDADILVFDEPTASIDAVAEHEFFQRLRSLCRDRTSVLISHRVSTARMADKILVVDRGCAIEYGTHSDLLIAGGKYAEMFALQSLGYS